MYTEQVNCICISFSTILSSSRFNFNNISEIRTESGRFVSCDSNCRSSSGVSGIFLPSVSCGPVVSEMLHLRDM
jgi:hypothetical protein